MTWTDRMLERVTMELMLPLPASEIARLTRLYRYLQERATR